jgi:hypothetical protein
VKLNIKDNDYCAIFAPEIKLLRHEEEYDDAAGGLIA